MPLRIYDEIRDKSYEKLPEVFKITHFRSSKVSDFNSMVVRLS